MSNYEDSELYKLAKQWRLRFIKRRWTNSQNLRCMSKVLKFAVLVNLWSPISLKDTDGGITKLNISSS